MTKRDDSLSGFSAFSGFICVLVSFFIALSFGGWQVWTVWLLMLLAVIFTTLSLEIAKLESDRDKKDSKTESKSG